MANSTEGQSASARVLARERSGVTRYRLRSEGFPYTVLMAIGATLAVVGMLDLVLAWLPVRFGVAGWEFATLSQTFTNLPVTLLGLGLLLSGFTLHPSSRPGWLRPLAVLMIAGAAVLAVGGVLFVISAIEVWSTAGPDARFGVLKAVLRVFVEIVLYPILLGGLGAYLWKAVESVPTVD